MSIIQHAVWRYHRFPLRDRDVQELLHQRGLMVSHETRREWVIKFGPRFAAGRRHREGTPGFPVASGTLALGLSVSLWALLFGQPHKLTEGHLEETRDPIRAGRIATNTQILIVAGLIAVALASERVIAHPLGPPSWGLTLLLFGGPLLVRLELTLYLWLLRRKVHGRYLLSSAGLALLGVMTLGAPPYLSLMVASGVLMLALLRWEEVRD